MQGPAHKPNTMGMSQASECPLPVSIASYKSPTFLSSRGKVEEAQALTMAVAAHEIWEEAFEEEEEALSLSGLQVAVGKDDDGECKSSDAEEDFEFRISVAGGLLSNAAETDMCAADEVFFQGQILPLRPSIGSCRRSWSRSRSDSFDQYSSAILGLGFNCASRSSSSSSRSSSSCVSRSHSSNSHSSSTSEHPRVSLPSNFCARPGPTPQVRVLRKASAGRRSTSSAPPGWGIFRLGIAKAPEIELYDMMSRRSSSCGVSSRKSNAEAKQADKAPRGTRIEANAQKKAPPRPGGRGFSCKCSSDALEPIAIPTKKEKEETMSPKRGETVRRSRVFEWLEDLSIAKATWS